MEKVVHMTQIQTKVTHYVIVCGPRRTRLGGREGDEQVRGARIKLRGLGHICSTNSRQGGETSCTSIPHDSPKGVLLNYTLL